MRTEDGSIIQECVNGESGAFGVLVDKYKEGIYAFAYSKLQDFQDAEDVTQEVFLRAYRGLRSLRKWESFAFWLYRIAYARCAEWLKLKSRRADQDFIEDQDPEVINTLSLSSYHADQLNASVREALGALPEVHREVLVLRYFGGMNSVEIAKVIGVSPAAIRMRLTRAREQLKEEMVAMMDTAFEGQRLPVGFTLRVVEAVKRMKIQPISPRINGLPWGLSLVTGLLVTILSLNPNLSFLNYFGTSVSSAVARETKVFESGEVPVNVLEIPDVPAIAKREGDGENSDLTDIQNTSFMAPQAEGGTWAKKADMPMARSSFSASVLNGRIYAIGGVISKNGGLNIISVVEEYDPRMDMWMPKTDMPTARNDLASCAVNGKIYAIGGNSWGKALTVVEEYDPTTDKWAKKTDMPTARCALSVSVANGRIYAIGGQETDGGGPFSSTLEEYDPTADRWTKKANMPTARGYLCTATVNNMIYAIGGTTHATQYSTVEEYNPATDTWTRKANMPAPRAGLSACVVDGKIYTIGGFAPASGAIEEYDPVTDTWMRKANMPTPRGLLGIGAANGKIYAMGGTPDFNITIYSTVEEYDTGFKDERKSIKTTGSLPTKWGYLRRNDSVVMGK